MLPGDDFKHCECLMKPGTKSHLTKHSDSLGGALGSKLGKDRSSVNFGQKKTLCDISTYVTSQKMADGPGLLLDFQEVSSRCCFQFRFSVSKPKMPKLTIAERQLAKGNWLSGIPGKHVHVRSLTIGGSAVQTWMWYFVVLWYPQHDFKEVFRSKFNPVNLTNRFHMISPPKSHTLRFSPDKSHDARAE